MKKIENYIKNQSNLIPALYLGLIAAAVYLKIGC